jgi:hypothetical protein
MWDASSMTKETQTLSIPLSFRRNLEDCFLGFVWDASSMTKEALNSNATNTFYSFVIPEESRGLFSWFCLGCFQHDKRVVEQ